MNQRKRNFDMPLVLVNQLKGVNKKQEKIQGFHHHNAEKSRNLLRQKETRKILEDE